VNYPVHFYRSFHVSFHKTSENSDKSDRLTGSLGTVSDFKNSRISFFMSELVRLCVFFFFLTERLTGSLKTVIDYKNSRTNLVIFLVF
jgi:fatty acid desaturase